jgi:uroporphyrinogen-III synthase
VPGILAHLENGLLAGGAKVERCDLYQRYPSDEAAYQRLRELGYAP